MEAEIVESFGNEILHNDKYAWRRGMYLDGMYHERDYDGS